MKGIRIAMLGLALVMGSTVASAQGGGGGGGGRGGRPNPMMVGITPSEEQAAKITEIRAKYADDMAAARTLSQTDRPAGMKKNAEISAKMNADIRAILTPDQQAVFDKNGAVQKARMDSIAKTMPPAI
jgi:Spy/CpxP family protein refolding chaperone